MRFILFLDEKGGFNLSNIRKMWFGIEPKGIFLLRHFIEDNF